MKIIDLIWKYITTILVLAIIFYLSLARFTPSDSIFESIPYFDKFVHFSMYFGLIIIFSFDLYRQRNQQSNRTKILLSGWIAAIAISGLIELAQAFLTNYRGGDWLDFLSNSAGATTGLFAGLYLVRPFIYNWHNRRY